MNFKTRKFILRQRIKHFKYSVADFWVNDDRVIRWVAGRIFCLAIVTTIIVSSGSYAFHQYKKHLELANDRQYIKYMEILQYATE